MFCIITTNMRSVIIVIVFVKIIVIIVIFIIILTFVLTVNKRLGNVDFCTVDSGSTDHRKSEG